MQTLSTEPNKNKRRAINLTINEEIVREAKALKLNTSKAAEAGIISDIKQARAEEWLRENKTAIQAYNEEIKERGLLLTPHWLES